MNGTYTGASHPGRSSTRRAQKPSLYRSVPSAAAGRPRSAASSCRADRNMRVSSRSCADALRGLSHWPSLATSSGNSVKPIADEGLPHIVASPARKVGRGAEPGSTPDVWPDDVVEQVRLRPKLPSHESRQRSPQHVGIAGAVNETPAGRLAPGRMATGITDLPGMPWFVEKALRRSRRIFVRDTPRPRSSARSTCRAGSRT